MNLKEWLLKIQAGHPKEIELGLERVRSVAERLDLLTPTATIITVGGTNGKGSCVAGLEAIYLAQGYRVGVFTTPYLVRHNEQVRIMGKDCDDLDYIQAFEKIELSMADTSLTTFEFNTLAALFIFKQHALDICILEVGLGGRLDAVNIVDTDAAVIASIDIDHADWLGDTREKIGAEKAGIFRKERPVICGDFNPPSTLVEIAEKMNAPFYTQNRDFGFEEQNQTWNWWSLTQRLENLPITPLALQNMATVLMTIECIQEKLPVSEPAIRQGLAKVQLKGRIQVIPGEIRKVFDVSHNPAATQMLAKWLKYHSVPGKTYAVFSMLADKDIKNSVCNIADQIDEWYIAPLPVLRGASLEKLKQSFSQNDVVKEFLSIQEAYQTVNKIAKAGDQIIVFGSFYTLAEIYRDNQS